MFTKFRLSILAVGAILATAGTAQAACQRVFSHTTCSGWGPMQKCQNHFKQQCTQAKAAPVVRRTTAPQIVNQNAPRIAPSTSGAYGYGGIVAAGGGNAINPNRLVGNDGGSMRR